MLLLLSADFSKLTFQRIILETLSECQAGWIQTRAVILPVQIMVQSVCKGVKQAAKVVISKETVKRHLHLRKYSEYDKPGDLYVEHRQTVQTQIRNHRKIKVSTVCFQ